MSVSLKRWNEGQGERYLADGQTPRCQACSKSKLRTLREKYNNPDLTSDDLWPEAQCPKGAVEGTILCKYHGGESNGMEMKNLLDYMPVDLREMAALMASNPHIYDQYESILALNARNAQLMSRLEEGMDSKVSIKRLYEVIEMLDKGEIAKGTHRLERIADDLSHDAGLWSEFKDNALTISKLIENRLKALEKMQAIATPDQVIRLVGNIYDDIQEVLVARLSDSKTVSSIMASISFKIKSRLGMTSHETEKVLVDGHSATD